MKKVWIEKKFMETIGEETSFDIRGTDSTQQVLGKSIEAESNLEKWVHQKCNRK